MQPIRAPVGIGSIVEGNPVAMVSSRIQVDSQGRGRGPVGINGILRYQIAGARGNYDTRIAVCIDDISGEGGIAASQSTAARRNA